MLNLCIVTPDTEIEKLAGEYDDLSLSSQVNRLRRYFVHVTLHLSL